MHAPPSIVYFTEKKAVFRFVDNKHLFFPRTFH